MDTAGGMSPATNPLREDGIGFLEGIVKNV